MPRFNYNPPMKPYFDLIYRDEDILVLNKQHGLLTVEGKPYAHKDCLETRIRTCFPTARVVHRLDRQTSGVIVMAFHVKAHRDLSVAFQDRKTEKHYIAEVWGHLGEEEGTIDLPIATDVRDRPKQRIDHQNGRKAVTHWQVLERKERSTRVGLTPVTGRSHQLRVHMLSLGCPIIGDDFYAEGEAHACADRMLLHADRLSFAHPGSGEWVTFEAPAPF
jgi:tRNA pseudouridine32 synthase/23S rRNA pseudouridine746 synthase